ncbi:Grx4 family monothiol glutaredoxin [Candidatus Annandia pinicola]|uniref:Grx4 family monothiol glutaredoxin n=1 Tax=Candidatus Annandia pinicola TaxID=1345117 RepID=UPI001D02B3CF|nr:Grx4 family monothiol glutaredoxin [Candidatus Annandia pinicola]UDG80358.1 Glutaredoxin 4 [Candidatus Annandia pinicola]
MKTIEKIKNQILSNNIIIYMKGTPNEPKCGFSSRAVKAISYYTNNFSYINILENDKIRSKLPQYSNWPTFPQIFINGKFIGGCDIIIKMFNNGKLKKIIKSK